MTRPDPPARLGDLRNLGPASERMLATAGITTYDELEALGAAQAYRRVVAAGAHPTRILLWALEGALLDVDWRDLPADRRAALAAEVEPA